MAIWALSGKRIWVAGHRGMVGSAVARRLNSEDCEILCTDRAHLDLTDQGAVGAWVAQNKPDAIILAAAKVGGILANTHYPADFLYQNLMIQTNVMHAAHLNDVSRLIFIGSSAVYPAQAPQPISEDSLLQGPLDTAHEGYAIAKIAGIKLVQAYRKQYGRDWIAALPTNLYGPGDNFDPQTSHVLPALISKVHDAKQAGADSITIWGTGTPRREFLHADDCADALVHLLGYYSDNDPVNVGCGVDLSILELTHIVCNVVGFTGRILLDHSKPDGVARKLLSVVKLKALQWRPVISLEDGITETYSWFLENNVRGALA
ncbi:GDP-L-fucose synthase [Roseinatronobacter sp. S2]|uniref:GDP-L-fucose synthase family protein n=1 Tax=Roseinatronobacter sp. S2 TaxID=3035471 RepID=UPI00240F828D|nr:GDP-L-fucose synthase [Roseinatronobacter sp. S2]WFE75345.1 GDP-L-fucose synthase [Roseinatronobacter sp. S2]